MVSLAFYVLSLNAQYHADYVDTFISAESSVSAYDTMLNLSLRTLNEWYVTSAQIPPFFFNISSISCSSIKIMYHVPEVNYSAGITPSSGSQTSEFVLSENSETGDWLKYTLKFTPDDFPQRIYFEERLSRDIFEGFKVTLREIYRSHKFIPQIGYFSKLVRSCSDRFNQLTTVEIIPRSETEIRFVYQKSSQSEAFSTRFRIIDESTFFCDKGELHCSKLFQELRQWYWLCGTQDFNWNITVPQLRNQKAFDNGIDFASKDQKHSLTFQESCTLNAGERNCLTTFFNHFVNCPAYSQIRLIHFGKILFSPPAILREMIQLFQEEIDCSVVSSANGSRSKSSNNLLKIRNCLTFPSDWSYDSTSNILYCVIEFVENIHLLDSETKSHGFIRVLVPIQYSLATRSIDLWSNGPTGRSTVQSQALQRLLIFWDRNCLHSALRVLRSCSISDIASVLPL
jgi:hypothetical protein